MRARRSVGEHDGSTLIVGPDAITFGAGTPPFQWTSSPVEGGPASPAGRTMASASFFPSPSKSATSAWTISRSVMDTCAPSTSIDVVPGGGEITESATAPGSGFEGAAGADPDAEAEGSVADGTYG